MLNLTTNRTSSSTSNRTFISSDPLTLNSHSSLKFTLSNHQSLMSEQGWIQSNTFRPSIRQVKRGIWREEDSTRVGIGWRRQSWKDWTWRPCPLIPQDSSCSKISGFFPNLLGVNFWSVNALRPYWRFTGLQQFCFCPDEVFWETKESSFLLLALGDIIPILPKEISLVQHCPGRQHLGVHLQYLQ